MSFYHQLSWQSRGFLLFAILSSLFYIYLVLLGAKELLKLVKKIKLVEGLSERELKNPEGAGFDLRLGEVYEVVGPGFLGVEERETSKLKLLARFTPGPAPKKNRSQNSWMEKAHQHSPNKINLKAHQYYVVKTIEKVNLPLNLAATFRPRSTLYRSGIGLFSGNVAPGYQGEINVGLYNFSDFPFEIELGARFLHIMFWQVKGGVNPYRGQWQGGRTTTEKREKQV